MLWRRGGADGGMELVMDAEQNCSSCPGGAQTSFLGAERSYLLAVRASSSEEDLKLVEADSLLLSPFF